MENTNNKALIVAKNNTEVGVFAEHLSRALAGIRPVLYLDRSGSGANKAIYKFTQTDNAVLVIPPRGRVLHIPWPQIDLAIIASIPFPAPEPAFKFLDWAYPQAMLHYKLLINKMITSGSPDLKIFLLDGRLTNVSYGKNFVELASQLCNCEPTYLET